MRVHCYRSYTPSADIKDALGRISLWYHAAALGIDFYIQEDRHTLAYLIDPTIERRIKQDMLM